MDQLVWSRETLSVQKNQVSNAIEQELANFTVKGQTVSILGFWSQEAKSIILYNICVKKPHQRQNSKFNNSN